MNDENTQPETDDVEGHRRRMLVADESADTTETDDVEGHRRRMLVADDSDEGDEDVEGHRRRNRV
jgi:hypothetical protein